MHVANRIWEDAYLSANLCLLCTCDLKCDPVHTCVYTQLPSVFLSFLPHRTFLVLPPNCLLHGHYHAGLVLVADVSLCCGR